MNNYVASEIPEQGIVQSIWAPHSQTQMIQGGTPYPRVTYIS